MKTRVLSAMVGLVILAVVLWFIDTLVLNVVMGIISILAVLELMGATGLRKYPALVAPAMLLAVLIPFARAGVVRHILMEAIFLIVLLFFAVLLKHNEELRIEQVAMAFLFSTFVPTFYSCAVYLRDDYGPVVGGFYIFMALGAAWLSDTGAYFVGIRFGKHKLAPRVSPKKTVEGSVGGLIVCTLAMLVLALGYQALMNSLGHPVMIKYARLLVVMPVFSVIGMMGDLSASVIKRAFGVKDFGHIMPGHGGVLDRFDSVLFTLPSVYILVRHIWIVFPVS